jgi:signal transduction histidine kinase
LIGLPYDQLVAEVSRLPRDAIVLITPIFEDGRGQSRISSEVAADIATASSAPAYSPASTLLGGGIVGGHMDNFAWHGAALADMALEILAGGGSSTFPPYVRLPLEYRVDARVLERFGLREASLPAGTSVEFRRPGLLEQHKAEVLATSGGIAALIGIITLLLVQVRKRRKAETALRESEERMAFAASSANVGFWRLDVATDALWATEHCRAMFGIAPDTPLTWEGFGNVVHPEDRHTFGEWLHAAHHRVMPEIEFRVMEEGHDVRWFICRNQTSSDEHGRPLVNGIFAEVTSRKNAEAAAERHREEIAHLMRVAALGELSGGIAHELSQPLASILANAQAAQAMLARGTQDRNAISETLEDVVQEGSRAGQIIHRLRRLLVKGERQSALINLNDLVDSTLTLLRAELVSRRIKVETNLSAELAPVSGDPVQLQQVLLNLAINAMEAMSSTIPAMRKLSISTGIASDGYVECVMSDRGQGISPDAQVNLFQPFFTTKQRGLGLGLSICSTIMTSHRGRLQLANADGGGAIATMRLPRPLELAAAS